MEQCLLLSSGFCLHWTWAWEGARPSKVYILEALTAPHPPVTFNYRQKAAFSRVGLAFVLFQADCKFEVVILFSRREVGVEWGDKNWRRPKVLGLKCLSQRRWLSAIFSLVRGMDWLFPLLDVHSWDHFVLACREGLMKELLKLLSDVFCESLQDYINLD